MLLKYCILLSIVHAFFIENDTEILPAHYTWKVAFANLIHKESVQVKLQNEGGHCTHMHTLLDKTQYIICTLCNMHGKGIWSDQAQIFRFLYWMLWLSLAGVFCGNIEDGVGLLNI